MTGQHTGRRLSLPRSTWLGLAEPRRAVPIALVSVALLSTELIATRSGPATLCLALFLAAFVLLVPATWRWARRGAPSARRVVVYGLLCALLVGVTTLLWPALLRFESYVAHPPAAIAILGLTAIAGYILGRDIDLAEGLHSALERSAQLTRTAEDARLLALRQHLDPHFLFNTLGAIAEWCREDPLVAERALLDLSHMLRTLFDGIRTPLWPLSREVEVLLALHALYALRDDERYALDAQLDGLDAPSAPNRARDAGMAEVPPLVLLPLFENALKHGGPGAPLVLRVTREPANADDDGTPNEPTLRVSLWNAGEFAGRRAGGTGIETVERRLALAYGDAATLTVEPSVRGGVAGTATCVTLPCRAPVAQPSAEATALSAPTPEVTP
jgi:hypothetical protein